MSTVYLQQHVLGHVEFNRMPSNCLLTRLAQESNNNGQDNGKNASEISEIFEPSHHRPRGLEGENWESWGTHYLASSGFCSPQPPFQHSTLVDLDMTYHIAL
jgi:hypothetical protein